MFQEFEQALKATGIDLDYRSWAGYEKFFPAMWETIRPDVETRSFEDAADRVRANAVHLAQQLDWLDRNGGPEFNESQACQITAALDLYHYVTPKLLLLTASILSRLEDKGKNGKPARESGTDGLLYRLFKDVQRTLPLPMDSNESTVALWPDYLQGGWQKIQALVYTEAYQAASRDLTLFTRSLSSKDDLKVSRNRLIEIGEDPDRIVSTSRKLEHLLPPVIINITLFQLDWQTPEKLSSSPYRCH